MVIAGRQWDNLVEMLTFHPELKFAWRVARVFAPLEHGHHNNFDPNRTRRRGGLRKTDRTNRRQRERESEPLRIDCT